MDRPTPTDLSPPPLPVPVRAGPSIPRPVGVQLSPAVPPIYSRISAPPPLAWWGRALALGISLGCLAMLVVGALLRPDSTGISTHTAMGFLPCQFERRTGLPCPSCGFTTSVSHFARGNPIASLYVQPMGFVIAVSAAAAVWIGAYIAISGRPVHRLMTFVPARAWLLVLLFFAVGGWGWKIFIRLTGRDGWG